LCGIDDLDFQGRVSFVKTDVEGFEFEVVRGAHALIERDQPSIFGEFNPTWLRMRDEDLAGELSSNAALGNDVFELEEQRSANWRPKDLVGLRRLESPFAAGYENLLLLPRAGCGAAGAAGAAIADPPG